VTWLEPISPYLETFTMEHQKVAADRVKMDGTDRENTLTIFVFIFFLLDGNKNRIVRKENEWDIIG
jgi:hypothetical protein